MARNEKSFSEMVEELEDHEDVVECKECFELFPKADCMKAEHGYICPTCGRGERAEFVPTSKDITIDLFDQDFPEYEGKTCDAGCIKDVFDALIEDEVDAIEGYEEAEAALVRAELPNKDEVEATFEHIKEEEEEHIEELEAVLGKDGADTQDITELFDANLGFSIDGGSNNNVRVLSSLRNDSEGEDLSELFDANVNFSLDGGTGNDVSVLSPMGGGLLSSKAKPADKGEQQLTETAEAQDIYIAVDLANGNTVAACYAESEDEAARKLELAFLEKTGKRGSEAEDLHIMLATEDDIAELTPEYFVESLQEHVNEEHPAIESDQELEGTDNAVIKCKAAKVIAHSEDEKPVDCKGEKQPLAKPLTESGLANAEITEFFQLCKELGLETGADLTRIIGELDGEGSILDKLKAYKAELGNDFKIKTPKTAPTGDRIAAYNAAQEKANDLNQAIVYGYSSSEDGSFKELELAILEPGYEEDMRNLYDDLCVLYVAYPGKTLHESLEEACNRLIEKHQLSEGPIDAIKSKITSSRADKVADKLFNKGGFIIWVGDDKGPVKEIMTNAKYKLTTPLSTMEDARKKAKQISTIYPDKVVLIRPIVTAEFPKELRSQIKIIKDSWNLFSGKELGPGFVAFIKGKEDKVGASGKKAMINLGKVASAYQKATEQGDDSAAIDAARAAGEAEEKPEEVAEPPAEDTPPEAPAKEPAETEEKPEEEPARTKRDMSKQNRAKTNSIKIIKALQNAGFDVSGLRDGKKASEKLKQLRREIFGESLENDYDEDEVECTWCEERFPKSECRFEVGDGSPDGGLGWLCSRCEAAIKSRGEDLTFRENSYWDFLDEE